VSLVGRLMPDATDQWRLTPAVQRQTGLGHLRSLASFLMQSFERRLQVGNGRMRSDRVRRIVSHSVRW
jgi:hypothetical protein